ncbi:hypothetical protein A9Q81_04185 [Gammaproteobacteria bacterium 42_54_T18]|nr:hypothetical protein A9Q81_04185 [Gammaproteobacteria bacterium 42_54_T18]
MKYRMNQYRTGCRIFSLVIGGVLSGLCSSFANSDVVYTKMDEHVAFHINAQLFTYPAYTQFFTLASQQTQGQKAIPDAAEGMGLLKGIVENHLLALAANDEEHDHSLGLYADTFIEYRDLLSLLVVVKPAYKADQVIVPLSTSYDLPKLLATLLKTEAVARESVIVNRIVSQENFSEVQKVAAQGLMVGRYQLPGDAVKLVSFWDVYRIQTVQNKAKVRRGDLASIEQGVGDVVDLKLLEKSVKKNKNLTDSDLLTLWQFVWDKKNKQQYYLETGIVMDLHHDQPLLDRFKNLVTKTEIQRYYQEHQSKFIQVGSVEARHIRVGTQIKADYVYEKLRSGMGFNEAVKRYSLAKDGGSLGFINKKDKNLSFVKKLALIQAVNKVSTPYRMLDGKSYEIILVDKKQPAPLPLSDKSVRNQIANILAVKKAKNDLQNSFSIWFSKYDVVLNSRYFQKVEGLFSYEAVSTNTISE